MSGWSGPWVWRRDATQIVVGKYGRPWSFVAHYERGYFVNVDLSAPVLGDCRLSVVSARFARTVAAVHGRGERRRIEARRLSWAEIDRHERQVARRRKPGWATKGDA